MPTSDETVIADLLDRWEEARDSGRTVGLDDLCRDHPHLRAAVQSRIDALDKFDHFQRLPSAAPPPPRPDIPGYDVQSVLGRGGMGVVYLARDRRLNRPVAIKTMTGDFADPARRERFRLEAEAVARLRHPNVVQVYSVGEADGNPYMVLEYVPGGTLGGWIDRQPRPPADVAARLEKLARGVQAAHEQGVVHRDLKPGNVLLDTDGEPKVTDFGLAKLLDPAADAGLTRSGAVFGTPGYMAPEQAAGDTGRVGPAADVYALGAILYEGLTGRPPFQGADLMDLLHQVLGRDPVAPRRLLPGLPADLETVALKCLEKAPARRYGTAGEVADELARFRRGEPIRAKPLGTLGRAWRWARRDPLKAATGAGLVVALLAVAVASVGWAVQADRLANERARTLREARLRLADSARARGLALCEQGDSDLGLELLGEALDALPAETPGPADRLRREVAGWVQTRRPLRRSADLGAEVDYAVASPDGSHLFVAFGGSGQVFTSSGEPVGPRLAGPPKVTAAAFSADNRQLAVGAEGVTRVDVATGRERPPRLPLGPDRGVAALAWSPDGRRLAAGTLDLATLAGELVRWDLSADPPAGRATRVDGQVTAVQFTDDSATLVAYLTRNLGRGGSSVGFFHPDTGAEVRAGVEVPGVGPGVSSPTALAVHGPRVRTLSDGRCREWRWADGRLLDTLPLPTAGAPFAASLSESRVAVTEGASLRVVSFPHGRLCEGALRHPAPVVGVATGADGLLTVGRDGSLRAWGRMPAEAGHLPGPVRTASAHGPAVVIGGDRGGAAVLTAGPPARAAPLPAPPGRVYLSAVAPDGTAALLAGGPDGRTVTVWDAAGRPAGEPLRVPGYLSLLQFGGTGGVFTTCAAATRPAVHGAEAVARLQAWDTATRRPLREATDVPGVTLAAGANRRGVFLVLKRAGAVELVALDGDTFEVRSRVPLDGCEVTEREQLAVHPSAGRVAVPARGGVLVWDETAAVVRVPLGSPARVAAVAFTGDDVTVGTEGGQVIRVDVRGGRVAWRRDGHPNGVSRLIAGRDGRAVSGGRDGTVRQWEAATGEPLGVGFPHPAPVTVLLAIDADRRVLAGCADGSVFVWDPDGGGSADTPADVRARIREHVGRRP